MTAVRQAPMADRLGRLVSTGRLLDGLIALTAVASLARIWLQPVPPRLQTSALALLATLPLLGRRRAPLVAPLASLAGCLGLGLVVPGALWEQLQFFFCALLCCWVLGSENRIRPAAGGLAVALAVAVGTVAADPSHHGAGDYVFAVVVVGAAWTGGVLFGVRAREATAAAREAQRQAAERDRFAAEQARLAAEAVAAERARIARELHDVIAHTVSVMVVQAGAAEHLLGPGDDRARAALHAIRESGKGALAELRRLLAVLRRDDGAGDPEGQPGLAEVPTLVERLRAAGGDVRLECEGIPRPLSPGLDQAAYRIVQEALTNTLKHAGGARTVVTVVWTPDAVELSVTDEGAGGSAVLAGTAGGRGLVGMRERAELYGGRLEAGPRAEGGFRVAAQLPA